MSPEQVTGRRDLDKRVDIYALGVVLYQMLTGKVPFDAESDYEIMRAQAEKPMPLASAVRGDLPPSVDALLQKLCAKKREDRFATCEDALAAVGLIEAEIGAKPAGAVATQLPAPTKSAPEEDHVAPDPAPGDRSRAKSKDVTTPPVASTRSGGEGAATTGHLAKPPRRLGVWIAAGMVLAACGSVATLVVTGVVPPPSAWLAGAAPTVRPEPSANATTKPSATASTKPSASTTAGATTASSTSVAPPVAAFDRLPGTWIGSADRALVAVLVADTIEFRVKDPEQFKPADYEGGEARFVLRRIPGEDNAFAVEDRLRPNPPQGFPFNRDRARSTCQDVRTEAAGSPLRATFDGARLSVELMKIEPAASNFLFEKGQTISCLGLGKLKASKVVSVLTRG
jgi:serine/threonine-protein kinase